MNKKKSLSILIVIMFIMSMLNTNAVQAVEKNSTSTKESQVIKYDSEIYVNPIYEGIVEIENQVKTNSYSDGISLLSESESFDTIEDAAKYMRKQMAKRTEVINFTVNTKYVKTLAKKISEMAMQEDESSLPNEGDYIRANYSGWSFSGSYTPTTVDFNYRVSYLSTYDQETAVDQEVKKVLSQLNVNGSDEYTKIKAIHDYITANVDYDKTLSIHSTYNAIIEKDVVCQGFASLTYRMLRELGVGVRYITGKGGSEPHGWNIVKINNKWYNVDNTWDENISIGDTLSYEHFLKSEKEFPNHTRSSEYKTAAFNKLYPMSTISYGDPNVKVSSITLNKENITLKNGASIVLSATVKPSNAGNTGLSWSSNDTDVATVDENGKVTAVGAGTAKISASAKDGSGVKSLCEVTVPVINVTSVKINPATVKLNLKETKQLTATVAPVNAAVKEIKWSSSDDSVVTVDENGNIKAVSEGTAKITATSKDASGKSAVCTVSVIDASKIKVKSIKLSAATAKLKKGETKELSATIAPVDAANKDVVWASSDNSIATVTENGKVTAVGHGTVRITAIAKDGSGKKAVCTVTSIDPAQIKVTTIKLSAKTLKLKVEETRELSATIAPIDAANKDVIWASSDDSIATVSEDGEVTAVAPGKAKITATAKDGSKKVGICTVTVS